MTDDIASLSRQVSDQLHAVTRELRAPFLADARADIDRLRSLLEADPSAAAIALMDAFSEERSFFHVKFHDGPDYIVDKPVLWEQSGRLLAARADLYDLSVALWRLTGAAECFWRDRIQALGGPAAVLRDILELEQGRDGRLFMIHDVGAHCSIYRRDEISTVQAAQAALGPKHAHRMVLALMEDLRRAGADPHRGNI